MVQAKSMQERWLKCSEAMLRIYDGVIAGILCVLQSDREKQEGLPVAPFMDREKVTKPTAQIGFIKFVLVPMFETVSKVSIKLCYTYGLQKHYIWNTFCDI